MNYQLGVNRNARHQLERDLANKDNAISIGELDLRDPDTPRVVHYSLSREHLIKGKLSTVDFLIKTSLPTYKSYLKLFFNRSI